MFAKLCVLILGVGVIGVGLLTTRQLRIQAAHELAAGPRRVAAHDRALWMLRIEIAERTQPWVVAQKIESMGPMEPIGVHRLTEYAQREIERSVTIVEAPSP